MNTTTSCAPLPDALADELDALRAQRARLIATLRAERRGGATVVRISTLLTVLGVRQ